VTDEAASLARSQVLLQAGVAVLSQANGAPTLALRLLTQ
jgi:flagellin-like hook-associated protein FlgL